MSTGRSIVDFPEEYVVVDTETTGLSPELDSIIEIAAVRVRQGAAVDTFHSLVDPGFLIDDFIQTLTGITNEMLKGAPDITAVMPRFLNFLGDSIVVGHNVHFDVRFLGINNLYIDTMRIFRKLRPELRHHRLQDMAAEYQVEGSPFHRASADCEYVFRCFELMREEVNATLGVEAFKKQFLPKKYDYRTLFSSLTAESSEIDATNPFFRKCCVFTGKLERFTRAEAAQIVINLGGYCEDRITQKTNYLIIGNHDFNRTVQEGKSSKQRKAEQYQLMGLDIVTISESVFYDMIENC